MKYKDYYATLGLERGVTQDEIKRAYRKLARKYHPDINRETDAEERFKEVGEAYEVLKDPEKRAAYDRIGDHWRDGEEFQPPPDWDAGFEFSGRERGDAAGPDLDDFFADLFGGRHRAEGHGAAAMAGQDHHAKVLIDLEDAYRGAQRTVTLQMPVLDAQGHVALQSRTLNVTIPQGIRAGQHLRLAGQGGPAAGGAPPGDLYLEIGFREHPHFRVDGRDVSIDLPVAPWEAALGARVEVPTPDGVLEVAVPGGSAAGRRLRLRGKGIPGQPPGDFYAALAIALPPADSEPARAAYEAMRQAFRFDPRAHLS